MSKQITIDGFNGTGKTTLARSLSQRLDYIYISTGIIFRSLSYCLLKDDIHLSDLEAINEILEKIDLKMPDNRSKVIMINGNDVTKEIMDMKYAIFASKISDNHLLQSSVRKYIRNYSKGKNVIIDGRDTGRLIYPNADLKLALIADIQVRAKRRINQSNKSGYSLENIINQINEIDKKLIETNCIPPIDAIKIDTTELSAEDVLQRAIQICNEKGIIQRTGIEKEIER